MEAPTPPNWRVFSASCAMSTATTAILGHSPPSSRRSDPRSARCTISQFPPSLFGVVVDALAKSGLNVDARLVVEKPFGHDRAIGAGAQSHPARVFSGAGDLSHRSLSRQGAGSEHRLYPVRERAVRVAVEPQLCAQHPDHHGGSVWGRRPRQLLRRDGGAPRRGAEPHASGACERDDGPADRRGP